MSEATGVNVVMTEAQVEGLPDEALAKIVRNALEIARERANDYGWALSAPLVKITAEIAVAQEDPDV